MADHTPPIAGLGPPAIAPAMEAVDQGGALRRQAAALAHRRRREAQEAALRLGRRPAVAFQAAIFGVGLGGHGARVAGELPAVAPGEHLDAATVQAQLAAFRRQRPAAGGAGPPGRRRRLGRRRGGARRPSGAALAERSVEDALEANDGRQTRRGCARRSAPAPAARGARRPRGDRGARAGDRGARRRPRRPRRRPRRPRRRQAPAPAVGARAGARRRPARARRRAQRRPCGHCRRPTPLAGPPPPPSPAAPLSPFTTLTAARRGRAAAAPTARGAGAGAARRCPRPPPPRI